MNVLWSALLVLCVGLCVYAEEIPSSEELDRALYWGSYRPGHYFGMRARTTREFETGMMVMRADDPETMRHECDMGDNLQRYGWLTHNGVDFGEHEIADRSMNLQLIASMVKFNASSSEVGGSWSNRFSGFALGAGLSDPISLFYYVIVPEGDGDTTSAPLSIHNTDGEGLDEVRITGKHPDVGAFTFSFRDAGPGEVNRIPKYPRETSSVIKDLPDMSRVHYMGLHLPHNQQHQLENIVKQELNRQHNKQKREWRKHLEKKLGGHPGGITRAMIEGEHKPLLVTALPNTMQENANVLIVQRILGTPFELDVAYVPHADHMKSKKSKLPDIRRRRIVQKMTSLELTDVLEELRPQYLAKVQESFALDRKRITPTVQQIVNPVLSNLIGGIGYFHGQSVIKTSDETGKESYFINDDYHELYSAVPSRPTFPRGFMWDEGFHQLLIQDWDERLTMESMRSWLNLMDDDGWIAREQILGPEARTRVPDEFIPQSKDHANPPTFFLVFEKMLRKAQAYRELAAKDSEDGHMNLDAAMELNFVSTSEADAALGRYTAFFVNSFDRLRRHIDWYIRTQLQTGQVDDLFRWRGRRENHTFSSGLDDYPRARFPSDEELHVDLACWVAFSCDVLADIADFISIDAPGYRERADRIRSKVDEIHWSERDLQYADIAGRKGNGYSHVTHTGYVNLFPLLLGMIPTDSPRLLATMKLLESSNKLWSPYGIRSLSVSDPYYGKGDGYWTGPIWVNINYLILRALKLHYMHEGPYHETAAKLYTDLRENLVVNIFTRYQETGYIWEQYNPDSGEGQRSHPFTGWSALAVSMVAEQF